MTRNIVAVVSAALFVILAALLAVTPVPYVTWNPGATYNVVDQKTRQPIIRVDGLALHAPVGKLLMTTVATTPSDATVSLPQALISHWLDSSQVVPRSWIYQPGKSSDQIQSAKTASMTRSQTQATVAALRAAGHPVTEMPMVESVGAAGPAFGKLLVGDLIAKVDGLPVTTKDMVFAAVQKHAIADTVVFEVLRDKETVTVQMTAASSNQDKKTPVVGVSITTGYRFGPTVHFGVDGSIGGPSAGLAFGLGLYDLITEGDLVGTLTVGATGTLAADGTIGAIGAIREKIYAAKQAQASAFLVPAGNCRDIADIHTDLKLVKVSTLEEAIDALSILAKPGTNMEVPHC